MNCTIKKPINASQKRDKKQSGWVKFEKMRIEIWVPDWNPASSEKIEGEKYSKNHPLHLEPGYLYIGNLGIYLPFKLCSCRSLQPVGFSCQTNSKLFRHLNCIFFGDDAAHKLPGKPVCAGPAPYIMTNRDGGECAGIIIENHRIVHSGGLDYLIKITPHSVQFRLLWNHHGGPINTVG